MPSSSTPMLYDSSSLFEHFVQANTLKQIQSIFYQICITEGIDSTDYANIYPLLRKIDEGKSNSKAEKLWTFLDKRRNFVEYGRQKICKDMNVLIIGAGPCGLRAGIEAALLGAKVIIVEQRDKFSRNNVLHLWEFVIQDLKALGAKIFYPKFCTGSIEHISIRQLQCILTKVALVLGVQIYDGISFSEILEPSGTSNGNGWKAKFEPHNHLLSEFQFDVLIGADGKRNTLPGFPKQVVRGKLAIGITANFVNKKSAAEEKVQEISGVAYIFNQTFFKDMQAKTGIDLENIVYYKDETHYFVMCAKKQSLLAKGVIKKDNDDISLLLSRENVDQEMLCKYAMQAADFATEGKLPHLEYSMNHRGQCDVAMFDFTALYSALHSTHLIERSNKPLIVTIVGDSLHEPFWPTGSGCARGFLGVFDAAWMLRSFGLNQMSAAEIIAERENVLKLLAQTTKEKMCKSYHKYTINPKTRYQHIARSVELQQIIECQIDSDNPLHQFDEFRLPQWFNAKANADFDRKCRLLRFCQQALSPCKIKIINFKALNWADGRALTALVSKFRKDLIDYANLLSSNDPDYMLDQVFTALEQEYGIQRPCCSQLAWANQSDERRIDFIEEVFNTLRCDPTSAAQILSPSVVKIALTANRKRVKKFDGTKMKRSEQIKRRAGDLLNAMASTSVMDQHHSETADDEEICISEQPTPLSMKQEYRIDFHHQTTPSNSSTSSSYFQKPAKTYTPRPVVDKLNPTIVCKVEQIVNGNLQRDHYKQLYDEKHRIAEKLTKKMEKESIGKIEEILEQTANGTLIDKNHQPSLSSQEEKMMRLNAASARNFAKTDFIKKQPDKFKEIDEKLAKAENILKFNNLAGINTVSDLRKQQQPKIPPPTPPKPSMPSGSFDEERENRAENGVVFRTTKYPFRRPVSSPQDLYASVLPRRRNLCALCGIEVYLAEQMHIDKLMIHKKCFKCSYCLQPLRLGNSALDRSLMDEFGPRWYCQQHNMLHISEKIARIQKNENKLADKNRSSIAVITPSATLSSRPMLAGQKPSFSSTESNSSTIYTTSNALSNSNNSFEHRQHDSYNSPTALARRTLDRMAARQAQVDALATPSIATTAPSTTSIRKPSITSTTITVPEERVEFECYRGQKINNNDESQESDGGKKSLESTSSNELESSLDDIEFIDGGSSDGGGQDSAASQGSHGGSCTTTEDEMDDEELWSEFSTVLENTLAKGANCSSDDISEQQAIKWIDIFNRRASLLKQSPQTPDSVYYTPKQRRSDETPIREFYTPATSIRPRLSQTRMKSFESPDADETLKFDNESTHSTLPSSSSAGTYTTIISTSDDYCNPTKPCIFDSMPSMQRATLSLGSRHRSRSPPPPLPAHVNPPLRSFDTPKRPLGIMAKLYNSNPEGPIPLNPKIGASESQKEANIINKMKKLRMRTNERRATVGIDTGTKQALALMMEEAEEREREIEKREKLFEEKKQQQNAINSGTTTTIEILDNTTSSKPTFYTPIERQPSSNGRLPQNRYSDPDKRKERRLRSRTTGIQKDHLQDAMKKISPALVASPKNIKKVQKQAEKILKRQECERQRTAQDVQRGLDETENRIAEVQTVGKELENALLKDPKNNWLLENWLLYVQELRQLKLREDDLNRRVKEISISDQYHKLRGQLNEIQQEQQLQPGELGPNILIEKEIMNKIVAILDEHQKIRDEMDQSMRHSRKTVFDIQKILNEKSHNFSNFEPIFTSNFTPKLDIFC